ncbi:hypothetical protein IK146_02805 [Candidatus Saccharibacteria bacterium]|nr:hypothetical protein [Candidatus Saccharibacteria bacterium]
MNNNASKPAAIEARSKIAPKKHYLLAIASVIFIVAAVFFLINHTAIVDTFKGIGYNPTPDMLTVKQSLQLTDEGTRIFNATRPLLASSDDFNSSCESHDEAVSVLGCYTGDRIYIYNVDDASLPGIRESTAAHELLHAIWNRLTGLEKSELVPVLEQVYSQQSGNLHETIESYPEDERIGELYVRIATQITSLPDALETHYAKYFSDQDKVASFYNSYIKPFNELNNQITQLKAELDALNAEITEKTAYLDGRVSVFDSAVAEFNRCANIAGCFSSEYAFNTRRAELVREQQSINAENAALNEIIDAYNQKAEVYNSSIIRSTELQNIINSNSPTTKIEE